ncbi:MAG: SAM-dependent methyltransferase [Nitrospiraceae bacterium]|nr:SAM-dependent methyltransferase [Nitrospiraceae bacterium]
MAANALKQKIIQKISDEGPITFERFMQMALYDPDCGYYASGEARVGRSGDFYTSSHLHPVFGRMLGRQVEEFWEYMGGPEHFEVVEMGPGAGHLCRDMLDYLKERDLGKSMRYSLIERNPSRRREQEELLDEYREMLSWFPSLDEISKMRGCLLSNELLDAFPVHLVMMEDELKEIYVTVEDGRLKEVPGPPSDPALAGYFRDLSVGLEKGCKTEVNLRIRDWLGSVGRAIMEGFVLTIDYGYTSREYYSEDRNRGTLMCYRRHQLAEDPLVNVGRQDITAHVNFSSLKRWGEEMGLRTIGFCGQGAYLTSLGIDEEIHRLSEESGDYLFELARIKKLILPQGMGESHMVMVQYKGEGTPTLRGFALRNRTRYL